MASGSRCLPATRAISRSGRPAFLLNRSIVQNDADLNRMYQDLLAQSRKSGGP